LPLFKLLMRLVRLHSFRALSTNTWGSTLCVTGHGNWTKESLLSGLNYRTISGAMDARNPSAWVNELTGSWKPFILSYCMSSDLTSLFNLIFDRCSLQRRKEKGRKLLFDRDPQLPDEMSPLRQLVRDSDRSKSMLCFATSLHG